MHTILGAGGAIGDSLARELLARGKRVRLVSRRARPMAGAAGAMSADLTDPACTRQAVQGAEVAYLPAGLRYHHRVWGELWPRIMGNAIEACRQAGARLIFFDNVYMYGRVDGPMTEETPFNRCSRKGEIRARIATRLLDEVRTGRVTALIARCADFYGPRAGHSVANLMVFDKLAAGAKAMWLVNDRVPHSWTYVPDAARSLVLLAESDSAWNQTWHMPTAPHPPTGGEFVAMAAAGLKVPARHAVLGKPLVRLAGLMNSDIRESYEMLYQNQVPYVFDSTKFNRTFAFMPTAYADGVCETAAACRRPDGKPSAA